MSKGWTEEQKAEASRKAKERWQKHKEASTQVHELASVKNMPSDLAAALEEIEALKARLAQVDRVPSEQQALARAESQFGSGSNVQEVPTGKTRPAEKLVRWRTTSYEKGRPIREPEFEQVDVPTYFYTIDMPPVGGQCLRINGVEYYHGQTYEFDIDTLRTVKSMVWNVWKHDSDIHGSDENAYRKQTNRTLSARF